LSFARLSAVENQAIVRGRPSALWENVHELRLDIGRGIPVRQTQTARDAKNMCVDGDRIGIKRVGEHHVGCLTTDSRQAHELAPRARHLTIELLDQDATGGQQVASLAPEQTTRLYVTFERALIEIQE
jgi:hypothetical protein